LRTNDFESTTNDEHPSNDNMSMTNSSKPNASQPIIILYNGTQFNGTQFKVQYNNTNSKNNTISANQTTYQCAKEKKFHNYKQRYYQLSKKYNSSFSQKINNSITNETNTTNTNNTTNTTKMTLPMSECNNTCFWKNKFHINMYGYFICFILIVVMSYMYKFNVRRKNKNKIHVEIKEKLPIYMEYIKDAKI